MPVTSPVVYPNPWNGTTPLKLALDLPANGEVKVRLFTASFRKVWQMDLQLPAGHQELLLTPPPLANGIYYLLVEAPGKRWIVRLMVLG